MKSGKTAREEREKRLILKHKFENRITVARFGNESRGLKDFAGAIRKFTDYLQVMAEVKGVQDIYAIKPQHFDTKKDVTEMLMISHIYFEMAKMYDAVPKFHDESKRCLDQFVLFSVNQPFQVINSELMRKHLKKTLFKNHEAFRNAYIQIFVQSKKCYVVTFCLGTHHPVTQEFRALKDVMLEYRLGQEMVRLYYQFSSVAVLRWEKRPVAKLAGKWLMRPILVLLSKTILRTIINK
ncbi:MAG: hypothetical protein V4598_14710 [Bdellovibrionota bacterium]